MIGIIDLETTGLDSFKCLVVELAILCMDEDGTVLGRFQQLIKPAKIDATNSEPDAIRMHEKSGLLALVLQADDTPVTEIDADAASFVLACRNHAKDPAHVYHTGNSAHFDRAFMKGRLPRLESVFGYRVLDVSSIRIATSIAHPTKTVEQLKRAFFSGSHRAASDCESCRAELLAYLGAMGTAQEPYTLRVDHVIGLQK